MYAELYKRRLAEAGVSFEPGLTDLEVQEAQESYNDFWPQEWGPKPSSLVEAFRIAKQKVGDAPKLIPIYGHRYLPDRPNTEGNPVFSVYQTDIIYYGSDFLNYLENEFSYYFQTPHYNLTGTIRRIEFWSDLVESNC